MRVIKRGSEVEHRIRCTGCGSILSYTRKDLLDRFYVAGRTYGVIMCPVCYKELKTLPLNFL